MKKQVAIFGKVLQYSFSSSKMPAVLLIVANILLGLLSAVQVWLIGQIVGALGTVNRAAGSPGGNLSACLPYLLGLFALLLLQKFLFSAIPYGRTRLYARVKEKMTRDLFEAVNRDAPVYQELNDQQIRYGRAGDFINSKFEMSFQSILTLISGFTSMMSVLFLLGKYHLLFPLVAVATSLPVVFIRLKQDKAMHAMYKEQYPANQLGAYYLNALTTRDSLIELQIFGAESLFLDRYQAIAKNNIRQRTGYFIRHALHGNMLEALSILAGNIFLIGYGLYLLFNWPGVYTLDMLSVIITGVMSAQEDVIGFAFNGKYIAQAVMYGEDFWDLIDNVPDGEETTTKTSAPRHTLELRNVSFHYPNCKDNRLKEINLTLRPGETIGVVGENGSGKSTLSKVLLGLYTPCEGEIRVDGAAVPPSGLPFDHVGSVFQDYVCYELTAGENIWFSLPDQAQDAGEIQRAAREADAHDFIGQLPLGYDTPVGSLLENSVRLSGGQWQRLAVARGFYARGSLLILDEPNASMDVMTEAAIYRQYYEQIRKSGLIGILISHRLGSTRFCDRILVLKDGRIVQDGTFDELIEQEGLYRTMYQAQSQWYQETEVTGT